MKGQCLAHGRGAFFQKENIPLVFTHTKWAEIWEQNSWSRFIHLLHIHFAVQLPSRVCVKKKKSLDQKRQERRCWASGDRKAGRPPSAQGQLGPPLPSRSWLQSGGGLCATVHVRATAPHTHWPLLMGEEAHTALQPCSLSCAAVWVLSYELWPLHLFICFKLGRVSSPLSVHLPTALSTRQMRPCCGWNTGLKWWG